MDKKIFREKSVERVSSPEKLDSYLKVASPRVWVILCAVIVLLVGFIVWGVLGKVETTEPTSCYIEKHELHCYASVDTNNNIKDSEVIKLDEYDGEFLIKNITLVETNNEDETNIKASYLYELVADCDLDDDIKVDGRIIIETISPIKFVFN